MVVDSYRFAAAGGGGTITFPITGVAASWASPTGSTDVAFTLGSAPAENDLLVAFVSVIVVQAPTDPSGWTNVLGANVGTSPPDNILTASMYYHRVTAGEAAASTVSWALTDIHSGARSGQISVAVLRGVATSGELVGTATASDADNTATPWIIADVTPTADCQIMAGVAGDGTQTQTTPATHTLQASGNTNQSNYLYSDDTLGSNGVATGTTEVTPSSSDEYVSIVACFAPA